MPVEPAWYHWGPSARLQAREQRPGCHLPDSIFEKWNFRNLFSSLPHPHTLPNPFSRPVLYPRSFSYVGPQGSSTEEHERPLVSWPVEGTSSRTGVWSAGPGGITPEGPARPVSEWQCWQRREGAPAALRPLAASSGTGGSGGDMNRARSDSQTSVPSPGLPTQLSLALRSTTYFVHKCSLSPPVGRHGAGFPMAAGHALVLWGWSPWGAPLPLSQPRHLPAPPSMCNSLRPVLTPADPQLTGSLHPEVPSVPLLQELFLLHPRDPRPPLLCQHSPSSPPHSRPPGDWGTGCPQRQPPGGRTVELVISVHSPVPDRALGDCCWTREME